MDIKVTFYEGGSGRLLRRVDVDGRSFIEQFDWDGWYTYHNPVFVKIDEKKAIELALSALQVAKPDYRNPGRAGFRLYCFDLSLLQPAIRNSF